MQSHQSKSSARPLTAWPQALPNTFIEIRKYAKVNKCASKNLDILISSLERLKFDLQQTDYEIYYYRILCSLTSHQAYHSIIETGSELLSLAGLKRGDEGSEDETELESQDTNFMVQRFKLKDI
ncbi:hypothetical protein chiPu_0004599 [Chiloscyllium punctatum]|uniref:Uncharacterized protein n=1 Tax=Chiloscyllium punctatum TaxID=137246 RepID=A0A401S722_CHIPU|nr:hypothetical protein [Chiloscyllium punctatum]